MAATKKTTLVEKMKHATKPLAVSFGEDVLTLSYRPAVVTFAWANEIRQAVHSASPDEVIVKKIIETIDSWDMEFEPGRLVLLTREDVMNVPTEILTTLIKAISNGVNSA